MRSMLLTLMKPTMGRVRSRISTKPSMTLVVRSFRHRCRGKLKKDSKLRQIALYLPQILGHTEGLH